MNDLNTIQYLHGSYHVKSQSDIYQKMIYIKKNKPTEEKTLLILPCNSGGANQGSYFLAGTYPHLSNNWRKSDIWLRNIRAEIYFAAQSCVEFKYHDGLGALVFEHEMHRVKNDFDYGKPSPDVFTFSDNEEGFNMYKMVEDLKVGIKRALDYGFTDFVSVMTPLSYKMGFYKAISELDMWDRTTMIDSRIGTYEYFVKFVNIIRKKKYRGILYHPIWSYTWSEQKMKETPIEFQYQYAENYIDVNSIIENRRIKGNNFEHFCPVPIEDSELQLSELVTKYDLPYGTPLYNGAHELLKTNNQYF